MNHTRIYDYLTRSRQHILDWVRPLSPEQYTRPFPIGRGSLASNLTHVMICEWYYVERMLGRDVPSYEQWPIKDETPPPFATLEAAWAAQAKETAAAIRSIADWDGPIQYLITDDHGQRKLVTASASDIFTQLAFHEIHHRAQSMNMLRQLGIPTGETDLDFNALMYTRVDAP
ncbi:MAG TPA: DinB family protein [Phycisphaerales bacterium]|nr:DinB family protein [Phycisphaerales bacterium]